jgi:hypothetical protein
MDTYTLQHDVLPQIRRDIDAILGPSTTLDRRTARVTQDALFALLAVVSDLAERVNALEARP